mmetsp:Transcript_10494/g.25349  ORF Transcript_10494/g.25349 Transcript_10494/m.25349 type:complete len:116 (-) Transcript_10494:74-421(-)
MVSTTKTKISCRNYPLCTMFDSTDPRNQNLWPWWNTRHTSLERGPEKLPLPCHLSSIVPKSLRINRQYDGGEIEWGMGWRCGGVVEAVTTRCTFASNNFVMVRILSSAVAWGANE